MKPTYICKVCQKEYNDIGNFKKHLKSHKNIFFYCEECNLKFKTKGGYNNHILRKHNIDYKCDIVCLECGKVFDESIRPDISLRSHILTHDITWVEYKVKYNLYTNIKIDINNKLQCQICGLITKGHALGSHLSQLHNITSKEYYDRFFPIGKCKWCNKETKFLTAVKGYKEYCVDCENKSKHATQDLYWKRIKGIDDPLQIKKLKQEWRKANIPAYIEYYIKRGHNKKESEQLVLEYKQSHNIIFDNNSRNNYSKVSQELFISIYNNLSEEIINKRVYFALYDNKLKKIITPEELTSNNEYLVYCRNSHQWKKLHKSGTALDFYIKDLNLLIEFDGTYWHNDETDKIRDEVLLDILRDIKILHIKEQDYNSNKEEELNRCLNFIKRIYNERIENN